MSYVYNSIAFQSLHNITEKEVEPRRDKRILHERTQNKLQVYEGEMATKIDKNMFALPWEDSNMVLVVEDQELHVHKWILTSQSPVFKAMFGGHLKEASQNNITLKEKYLHR